MWNPTTSLLVNGTWETIYMVGVAGIISIIGGVPLGVILLTTRKNSILQNKLTHWILASIVNIVRSIPFIILLVAIVPFTRLLVGTSIGTTAAMVPLALGAIPFVARIVESALAEVSSGLIEAGLAMGATPLQIIIKILLPEAMPAMINGITITLITLVGYSAMAGAVGGGGLGAVAINYGYQRYDVNIMIGTIIILIVLVYIIQWVGDWLSKRLVH